MSAIEKLGALLNEFDRKIQNLADQKALLAEKQEELRQRHAEEVEALDKELEELEAEERELEEVHKPWAETVKELINEVGERDKSEQATFCGFAAKIAGDHDIPFSAFAWYGKERNFEVIEPEIITHTPEEPEDIPEDLEIEGIDQAAVNF
jgi:FtsZ-binding cell division protein ZapB